MSMIMWSRIEIWDLFAFYEWEIKFLLVPTPGRS